MSKQSTVWLNVTTSYYWNRPPVGILRVEQSLSTELTKLYGSRFKKCIWQDNAFIELPPTGTPSPSHDSKKTFNNNSNEVEFMFPVLPKNQALKVLAQGFLSLLPAKLRPSFNKALYFIQSKILLLIQKNFFLRRIREVPSFQFENTNNKSVFFKKVNNPEQLFAAGDVLISVGLDWDYPYYKSFFKLRKDYGLKIVSCCYDLIPVLYPQFCVNNVANIFTSYFLELADASDLMLCISKQSKQDFNQLIERTGGAMPPTHVFPLGDNVPINAEDPLSQSIINICKEPFILFVSTIERRKNHEVLYRAYHILCEEGKREQLPKLVFVGMPGWGVNDCLKDIELDPKTQGLILRFDHATDSELFTLYQKALFCVFPSFYEGWGLPVGEALAMGKPVIASNRGALLEVGGNMVCYADPWKPQEWASTIYRMTTDDKWRESWENNIKKNYKIRTWSETGQNIKSVLQSKSIVLD